MKNGLTEKSGCLETKHRKCGLDWDFKMICFFTAKTDLKKEKIT